MSSGAILFKSHFFMSDFIRRDRNINFFKSIDGSLSKGLQSLLDFWMKSFSQYSSNASSAGDTECFSWSLQTGLQTCTFYKHLLTSRILLPSQLQFLCSFWLMVCCSDKFASIGFNFFLLSQVVERMNSWLMFSETKLWLWENFENLGAKQRQNNQNKIGNRQFQSLYKTVHHYEFTIAVTLQCRLRASRWIPQAPRRCDEGCRYLESLERMIQKCPRTDDVRHNVVMRRLENELIKRGYKTKIEPRIPTEQGLKIPDLCTWMSDTYVVCSCCDVVAASDDYNLDNKVLKYDIQDIHAWMLISAPVDNQRILIVNVCVAEKKKY